MSGIPVLVIEDNEANMRLIRYLLTSKGYEPQGATNAAEALELLKSFRPRLILMDMQLPGMDGYELTRQLKSAPETKDIVIIALTAFAMKGDEEKIREGGCEAYIAKPISVANFLEVVERFLS